MKYLIKVFENLTSVQSINQKQSILLEHYHDSKLKELLIKNLNPYILFNVNKLPFSYDELEVVNLLDMNTNYNNFIDLLEKLENKELIGNQAKNKIKLTFSSMTKEEYNLYKKIICKSSIGVTSKIVNKVWENLIPEFKVLKASNELVNPVNWKYPCYLQPKLDGYRCIYKDGNLISRSGKKFNNKNLTSYFENLMKLKDIVLDGELYHHDLKFSEIQKILNSENEKIPDNFKYVVYDAIPEENWEKEYCPKTYEERLRLIRNTLNSYVSDYKKIIDISNDLVNSSKEVLEMYKNYLKKGYEGVMLKDIDGLYQWKRVTLKSGIIGKLKPNKTVDLPIKEIYEGEDNFTGMAGGVVVDYNGVKVKCSSGFSLKQRQDMFKNPNKYLDKIIEISYFMETDKGSLRSPIFKGFREDKQ